MALKPLYDEMLKQILASKNIFIDETPVKLQDQDIGKCKQAYITEIKTSGSNRLFLRFDSLHGELHRARFFEAG